MKLYFRFSKVLHNVYKLNANVKKFQKKLSLKQTLSETQQLQKFIQQTDYNKLHGRIQQTAQHDVQFKKFLQQYRKQHQHLKILDLTHYSRDFDSFLKLDKLKQEELQILEEFKKRKMEYQTLKLVEDAKRIYQSPTALKRDKIKQKAFDIYSDFILLILTSDRVCKVTPLQRIFNIRTVVVMGNVDGLLGYGFGKAPTYKQSLQNAITNCKKNIIALPKDPFCQLPLKIKERMNNYKLTLKPDSGFNSWGHPILSMMIGLSGIMQLSFRVIHRSRNLYTLVRLVFKTLTRNTTPRILSQKFGVKLYHQNWRKKDLNYKDFVM